MVKPTLILSKAILCGSLLFGYTACSDTSTSTQNSSMAEQEHKEADEAAASGQVVVETPDYTSASAPMKDQLERVLEEYLEVKEALVFSDAKATQEHANNLLSAVQLVKVEELEGEQKSYAEENLQVIRQSGSEISGSADLGAQRQSLQPLSEAVFSLAKAFGATDQTLYYQHCPMAFENTGAYWVSANSEIRNPYFGDAMLKCGSNEEVLD